MPILSGYEEFKELHASYANLRPVRLPYYVPIRQILRGL